MTKEDKVDLDDVLVKFNIFDRYHGLAMLWLLIGNASNCVYTTYYIFATEEVKYRCYDTSSNINDTCSRTCNKWIYENPDSFVAEYDLACQDWKRSLVGTIHSVGTMFGLIVIGPLSDRLGRKLAMILSGVAGGVIGLARSFSPWYWLFICLEFLEAMIGDPCSPLFMLGIEMVATKKRIPFSMILGTGYPLGGMITPLMAWLFPYWRTFIRVIYAPALLFIFYIYLLDESPRWLLTKQKPREAKAILIKAATTNKIKVEEQELENLSYVEDKGKDFLKSLKDTLQSKIILKRFLVCVVWWITCTFVDFGLFVNSVSLQGNKYMNFALLWFIELPAIAILVYALRCIKKRTALILSFCCGGILCILQPFAPKNFAWLSFILYMAGKVMSTFFFNVTYIFTSELFPTYTRNSMHALCSALGRIGSIIAPQTPLLMVYWSGLPSLIFGSLALIAGLLTFLVPDTSETSLPDTVEEIETIEHKRFINSNAPKPDISENDYV